MSSFFPLSHDELVRLTETYSTPFYLYDEQAIHTGQIWNNKFVLFYYGSDCKCSFLFPRATRPDRQSSSFYWEKSQNL